MFTQSTTKVLALATGLAALSACGPTAEDIGDLEGLFESTAYEAEFIDQDAAGEINGITWEYTFATASPGWEEGELSIELIQDEAEDICNYWGSEDKVMFSIPEELGSYELSFGTHSATLVDFRDGEAPMNYIAVAGLIEIEEITETQVKGRLDVQADGSTFVNGNFIADRCD